MGKKKSIGAYSIYTINKPKCLHYAKSVGLDIPDTVVTTKKKLLLDFQKKHTNIVIKAIQDGIHSVFEDRFYNTYTELVNVDFINRLPEEFMPTCFQEMLDKKYEIRTFFLNDNIYSMAIFSQADPQTKIDFRKYNYEKPARCVPFQLPTDVSNKLVKFMLAINLNCGSFDIVYTKCGKFVFLEVNPIGQYGMVSEPCNYYLDKLIAQSLSI